MKTYTELCKFSTFEERFNYVKDPKLIGQETFGWRRYLNQVFYNTKEWERIRDYVIQRDDANDLAMEGYQIKHGVYVHHLNFLTERDIIEKTIYLLDPEFMVCTSFNTHNAIHFGKDIPQYGVVERFENDTIPWKLEKI